MGRITEKNDTEGAVCFHDFFQICSNSNSNLLVLLFSWFYSRPRRCGPRALKLTLIHEKRREMGGRVEGEGEVGG